MSRAPGIAAASASPASGGINLSSAPQRTRTGTAISPARSRTVPSGGDWKRARLAARVPSIRLSRQ